MACLQFKIRNGGNGRSPRQALRIKVTFFEERAERIPPAAGEEIASPGGDDIVAKNAPPPRTGADIATTRDTGAGFVSEDRTKEQHFPGRSFPCPLRGPSAGMISPPGTMSAPRPTGMLRDDTETAAPRGCFANGGSRPPRLVATFYGIFRCLGPKKMRQRSLMNTLAAQLF